MLLGGGGDIEKEAEQSFDFSYLHTISQLLSVVIFQVYRRNSKSSERPGSMLAGLTVGGILEMLVPPRYNVLFVWRFCFLTKEIIN